MDKNFADRLLNAISEKKNPGCIGLDPRIDNIPEHIKRTAMKCYKDVEAVAEAFIAFNKQIIDAVHDIVPVVKPQMAFYEKYGSAGVRAFEETVNYAKEKGLIVIEDAKRNDIGTTAKAYADGHLGEVELCDGATTLMFDVDAITVNPYLGVDGIKPFTEACKKYKKGIFVLAKTSNPSSYELQDKIVKLENWQTEPIAKALEGIDIEEFSRRLVQGETPNYMHVATLINEWGQDLIGENGYSCIGAVVGATYPTEAEVLRKIIPKAWFLVPGYGAQGATAKDVIASFNEDGYGAIVNSSRGVIFAYQREPYKNKYSPKKFANASRAAALAMKEELIKSLEDADKLP